VIFIHIDDAFYLPLVNHGAIEHRVGPMAEIDAEALRAATEALESSLSDEADAQNAYLFKFTDGRVSLELECVDIKLIAERVIVAYFGSLDGI
jgi:hypothetical protein